MNNPHQRCPVCNQKVEANAMFPQYVCNDCKSHATDEHGDPVVFYHARFNAQGFVGYYRRNNELVPFVGNSCIIHGVKCVAMDDHLGSVVLLPAHNPFEERTTSVLPGSVRHRNVRAV